MNRFFLLTRDIRRADFEANRAEDPAERLQRRSELALLRRERDRIRLPAERAISELVSQALEQEGLAPRPVPGAAILPPVAFTLVRPPSVLVISPRTEIRLERTTLLQPGLTDADALRLERDAESLGWSSLVEPTGGYSTYPTIVSDTSPRDFTFSAVAHEWSHTYFIFKPLGFNYFQSPQMRVINETAADIVGRTIAERILEDHFGVAPAQPPGGAEAGPSPPDPPDRFDFRREMRETRLEVERLLQEARVDEAERYMEARRLMFVREGYNIRRLNQAYFAFHGTYAGSPGSINPIGPQLEALFDKTGSLREFVHALERVGSAQDYQRLLETYRVPATTP